MCHCVVWKQMFRAQGLSFGLGRMRYMCQQAFYWQLCHLAAWRTHDIILIISVKHNNSLISANWHIFPEMQSSQPVTVILLSEWESAWKRLKKRKHLVMVRPMCFSMWPSSRSSPNTCLICCCLQCTLRWVWWGPQVETCCCLSSCMWNVPKSIANLKTAVVHHILP